MKKPVSILVFCLVCFIIEGIGYEKGLFPSVVACNGWQAYDDSDYVYENTFCWDGTVADTYAGGDGTPENPYKIATAEQLALLAQQTNEGTGGDAWYELTANIDLQRCDGGSQQWISIGNETNMFKGHFNGNNNFVLNLYQFGADDDMQKVFGLFGYTDRAEICNVQLEQCTIRGKALHVGGLVGYAGLTNISNCSITQSSVKTETGVAGGLVGSADMPYGMEAYFIGVEPYHITRCYVVEATWIEGASCAGGIVGAVNRLDGRNPCEITDCMVGNNGYPGLYTVISQHNAGGIVGWFQNGTITGCLNQFDITGGLEFGVGGIAGEADLAKVNQCANEGKVFGEYAVGGIVGLSQADGGDILEVMNCTNTGGVLAHNTSTLGAFAGGVVGSCWNSAVLGCVNTGDLSMGVEYRAAVGGIVGYSQGLLANCYNRGTVLALLGASAEQLEGLYVGGIVGRYGAKIYNVYNTGVIDVPDLPGVILHGYGNIIGEGDIDNDYLNAYWLDDDDFPACGLNDDLTSHASSAFVQGATSTSWILNDTQYGTNDLLEALNHGATFVFETELDYPYLYRWEKDAENENDGFPVLGEVVSLVGTKFFDEASRLYYIITSSSTVEVTCCTNSFNTYIGDIVIPETVVYRGVTYTVTAIGNEAFRGTALTSVNIPDQVKFIGMAAFGDCNSLRKVELGNNVSYLAEQAFMTESDTTKLTVVCHNPVPAQCGHTTFPDVALQEMVVVPCGCEEAYRLAWGEYWQSGNFEEDCETTGTEWYYEIENEDGSITFQYLMHESDTVIDKEDVHILVRINTLYDKGEHMEKSREYIYEKDGIVYWWNDTLGEFTVLYDYDADEGDEWEIKVGAASVLMHVDAVEQYEYEGRVFKILLVSDAEDLFGGIIVCGIGHLTSFFPERLMSRGKGYRVEGIRCFWQGGELVFKYGEKDCDEVYKQYHNGVEESGLTDGFSVYPNPTDGVIVVGTICTSSQPEYRITNMIGQTLMKGHLDSESRQIIVSSLPNGLYFITIANKTLKFIKQ